MTRQERNEKQRIRRRSTRNASDRKYHHTIKGYLVRTYRTMKSRVSGINKKYAQYYFGKPIMPKDDFYNWALNNDDFKLLFKAYEASGWNSELAPSVDRIDPAGGYTLDNVRYMTLQQNRELGLANARASLQKEEAPCPF